MGLLAHVTTVFEIPGPKRATINLDYALATDFSLANLQAMTDAAVASWNVSTGFKSINGSWIKLLQVEAFSYDLEAIPAPPPGTPAYRRAPDKGPVVTASGVAGTQAGVALPPQVAVCVSFRTAVPQRRARGRVFLPSINEATVDEKGLIDSNQRNLILARFYDDYVQDIEDAVTDAEHSIVSLTYGVVNMVTSAIVRQRVDTQRRRLTRSIDTA